MLLSAAGGNEYRDRQPDNMQRMRNLGKPCPKRDASITTPPQDSGNYAEEEAERMEES